MLKPDDDDPIMAELRQIRQEQLERVGFDLKLWDEERDRFAATRPGKRVCFDKDDPDCVPDTFHYSDVARPPPPGFDFEDIGDEAPTP